MKQKFIINCEQNLNNVIDVQQFNGMENENVHTKFKNKKIKQMEIIVEILLLLKQTY